MPAPTALGIKILSSLPLNNFSLRGGWGGAREGGERSLFLLSNSEKSCQPLFLFRQERGRGREEIFYGGGGGRLVAFGRRRELPPPFPPPQKRHDRLPKCNLQKSFHLLPTSFPPPLLLALCPPPSPNLMGLEKGEKSLISNARAIQGGRKTERHCDDQYELSKTRKPFLEFQIYFHIYVENVIFEKEFFFIW